MTRTPSAGRAGNLTADMTSFVGRRRETADVRKLLSSSRLTTLTGVGGVGKTRLALRVASETAREYDAGVWFVDLASLDDEALLTQTVATALGLQEEVGAGWPVSVIASHLEGMNLLLILDNCEHVRDACAVLVEALLRRCPELTVMTTSRQTLGVTGEHVFTVPPLSLPEEGSEARADAVTHYEAVDLFVARARAVRPTFELSDSNVSAVTGVCRRLDGIPLAIELAAARVTVLSVQDLLERLEHRFALLNVGSPAALPRHQTLREMVSWSWDLCTELEQTLWARMAVFPSDFDLRAAESVCAGGALSQEDVLEVLTGLVQKTVVGAHDDAGRSRYRMLDTLREYGLEQLEAREETDRVREAHRSYYERLVVAAREDSFSARQQEWLSRLRPEYSNIRAALEMSLDVPAHVDAGFDMVTNLWLFWFATGRTSEARRWLDRGLRSSSASTPARTRALETCAYLCIMQGDTSTAMSLLAEAKLAAAGEGDPGNAARAIHLEALAFLSAGDLSSAEPLLRDVMARPRDESDLVSLLDAYFCLAAVKALQGDLEQAEELCLEAIRESDLHGESWGKSYMLWCLGFVCLQRSDVPGTVMHGREALRLGESLDEPWAIACSLELLAWAAVAAGDAEGAAHLLGAAQRIWGRTGVSLLGIRGLTEYHDRCLRMLRDALDDQRLGRALDAGAAMSLEDAVSQGLGKTNAKVVGSQGLVLLPSLTKRESEVAGLVAQGLTNKEIAASLVISQRTAEAHMERILNKLGFTSRAQVAAWVAERRGSAPADRTDT